MNNTLKKIMLLSTSSALLLSISNAMAISGAYVGLKGGYNSSSFPNNRTTTGVLDITFQGLPNTLPDANTSSTKASRYFGNIHAGYLFPIKDNIEIGTQVGYSYYGRNRISNSTPVDPNSFVAQQGAAKITLSSINLSAVGEYDFEKYFIQLRGGIAYMFHRISNDYQFTSTPNGPGLVNKEIKSDGGIYPIAGISLGWYITQHISASISYDHIFAANDYNFDSIGNYNETSYIKVPSMDLIGAQISYHF